MIAGRVFVVGCPRSGTTLLQSVLAAHPRIHSFPETHFFSRARPRRRWVRALVPRWLPVLGWRGDYLRFIGREDLLERFPAAPWVSDFSRWMSEVLDHLAEEAGKDIWVEKTPRHLHCIETISGCLPEARFVHLLREGRETVASLLRATSAYPEAWGGRRSLATCIQRWKDDIGRSASYRGRPGHHLLTYEGLLEAPEQEARRLCRFLEVDFHEAMVRPERVFDQVVRAEDEPWKAGNRSPLARGERARDLGDLPESTREALEALPPLAEMVPGLATDRAA